MGDSWYLKVTSVVHRGRKPELKYDGYHLEKDGLLWYQGRMYVPKEGDIKEIILRESHRAHYCAHPGVKKMYADMKKIFF